MKDPDTGKRRSRPNTDDALVVHDVPELRIIDDALWQAVKDRQMQMAQDTRPDSRSSKPFHQQTRPKFLLSGLIQCGCCGAGYVKVGRHRFGCAAARNKGAAICTNMLTIRRETFDAIVIDGFKNGLMDPALFKVFAEAFHLEVNRSRIGQRAARASVEQELARMDKRIRRIVDLLTESDDAPHSLLGDLKALEARKGQLEAELREPAADQPLFHPNLAEIYRQKVADLGQLLEDSTTKEQAFQLIRSLIEVIRLIPEDGQLRVELRGELAGILALCGANAKKPDHEDPAFVTRQLKMVAGT
jgi:site-specific DNA recombinase